MIWLIHLRYWKMLYIKKLWFCCCSNSLGGGIAASFEWKYIWTRQCFITEMVHLIYSFPLESLQLKSFNLSDLYGESLIAECSYVNFKQHTKYDKSWNINRKYQSYFHLLNFFIVEITRRPLLMVINIQKKLWLINLMN